MSAESGAETSTTSESQPEAQVSVVDPVQTDAPVLSPNVDVVGVETADADAVAAASTDTPVADVSVSLPISVTEPILHLDASEATAVSTIGSNSEKPALFSSFLPNEMPVWSEEETRKRAGTVAMYDVEPKQWGRHFWNTLHMVAYAYPETPDSDTQQAAFQFFDALRLLLPCSNCRANYAHNWVAIDLKQHLHTRTALIEWMILLHDSVNKETGAEPLDYAKLMNRLTGTADAVVAIDSLSTASTYLSAKEDTNSAQKSAPSEKRQTRRSYSAEPKPVLNKGTQVVAIQQQQHQQHQQQQKQLQKQLQKPKQTYQVGGGGGGASSVLQKIASARSNALTKTQRKSQIQVKPPKPCPSCTGKRTITPSTF